MNDKPLGNFYPFHIRKGYVYGWAFRRTSDGRPILHSLRIRRIPAITAPGMVIMRNPNAKGREDDKTENG